MSSQVRTTNNTQTFDLCITRIILPKKDFSGKDGELVRQLTRPDCNLDKTIMLKMIKITRVVRMHA